MAYAFKAYSALAVMLLAASPCYAMSTVTNPANNNAASRFTDPNGKPQRGFNGSVTTVIIGNGSGSFGYGGAGTLGTGPLGNRGFDNAPFGNGPFGSRIFGPSDPALSGIAPSFPRPGFPDPTPYGFNQDDPVFGSGGVYAPTLRGNSR